MDDQLITINTYIFNDFKRGVFKKLRRQSLRKTGLRDDEDASDISPMTPEKPITTSFNFQQTDGGKR